MNLINLYVFGPRRFVFCCRNSCKKMSSTTPDVISCSTFTQQFTHPQLDDVIRAIRKSILSVVALDHTKICHYS